MFARVRLACISVLLTGVMMQMISCGGQNQGELNARPDFVGWVTGIEADGGKGYGRLIVESQTDKIIHRLIVTVTSDTRIYRREAGTTRLVGFAGVVLHDQAQLWLTGPVPQSFPAQVTARQVVVERIY